MRKLQLLTAMAIGISATAIGAIQVEAADYVYFVDFSTKTVANFNDYTQQFLSTTYDLKLNLQVTVNTFYKMNTCLPATASDVFLFTLYRANGTGSYSSLPNVDLPDMPCQTGDTFYQITTQQNLDQSFLDLIINDDTNYIQIQPQLVIRGNNALTSRTITLTDVEFVYTMEYDFDTTYLFNYFLSDSVYQFSFGSTGVTLTGTVDVDFDYVMTTAGNDRYFIINSNTTNYGTTRTKWAIDYNMEYFRGESIGSRYIITIPEVTISVAASGTNRGVGNSFGYYYLNAATANRAIVDAPEFDFTYEDCGWDVFDIPCFINNGLAYITNDAPIISDAITLLNAGIAMAAQTFGIIGAFTTDNVFGYLILAGFGFIAVRWFLKND